MQVAAAAKYGAPPRLPRMSALVKGLVCFSYFISQLLLSVPMSALPAIGTTLHFRSSTGATLAATGTVAGLASKLGSGGIVDWLGGKRALILVLALLSLSVAALSAVGSIPQLVVAYSLCLFTSAPMWPAVLLLITEHSHKGEYDSIVRLLSIVSRVTNIGGRVTLGAYLEAYGWGHIALATAAMGAAAVLIDIGCLPMHGGAAPPPSVSWTSKPISHHQNGKGRSNGTLENGGSAAHSAEAAGGMLGAMRGLLGKAWYRWALGCCGMLITLGRFEFVVGFFLEETSSDLSPSLATMITAAYPLGLFTAVLGPGHYYARMNTASRRKLLLRLQALSTLACALLVPLSSFSSGLLPLMGKAIGLFLVTFGFGVAYYIAISSAAMRLSPTNVALCTATLDACGYFCALLAQYVTSLLLHHGGWAVVWAFMCAVGLVALRCIDGFTAAVQAEEERMRLAADT